jgi:hypothetical protein
MLKTGWTPLPQRASCKSQSKSHYDQQSVQAPIWDQQFYFLVEMFFRQLRIYNFVAPSLMRGRVCNLLLQWLLGLVRAVTLGSKSRRTHCHILLSHLRLPDMEGQVPVFISPRNMVAQLYPRALGSSSKTSECLWKCDVPASCRGLSREHGKGNETCSVLLPTRKVATAVNAMCFYTYNFLH